MGKQRDYVVRYAKARGISEDAAFNHKIVREVCRHYGDETLTEAVTKQVKEQIYAGRNERVADITDCKGC